MLTREASVVYFVFLVLVPLVQFTVGKRELVRLHTIDFRGCGVPLE